MATKKISELEAVTTAEDNDVLVLVDVSEGTTNKITKGNLLLSSGNQIEIDLNSETYQLVFKLKNSVGTVLSTATIDLPSENAITKIEYDQGELKITKQSGSIETVDISGLIEGLVTESDFNTFKTQLQTTLEGINEKNEQQDEAIEENYKVINKLEKKLADQQAVINQMPQVEDEGTEVTLEDTIEAPFTKFETEGHSKQESTEGRNYLPTIEEKSSTNNGVIVSSDGEGKITIKGTPTAAFSVAFDIEQVTIPANSYIHLRNSGGTSANVAISLRNGNTNVFSTSYNSNNKIQAITEELIVNRIVFFSNSSQVGTAIDITLQPSIELTDAVTDFEKYTNGASPSPNWEQPIKSCGDNVNELNTKEINSQFSNIIINDDESITFKGNVPSYNFSLTNPIVLKANEPYTLSLTNKYSEAQNSTFILRNNDTNIMACKYSEGVKTYTPTIDTIINTIRIYNEGINYSDYTFKAKLEKGNKATPWSPYGMGSITEKIVDENFFSFTENTISYAGVTTNIDETKMKFNGKMASVTNIFNSIREDKAVPAGTYKLSYTKLSGSTSGSGDWAVYFNFYNANGTRIANKNFASNESGTAKDLVLSEDVAYYNYYAYCNSTSLTFNDLELGFMITKDTPTDYIAHKEQTYTIPVQRPMRSIGDVRDVFFKNTKDSEYYDENLVENGWYEGHLIHRIILTGDEEWNILPTSLFQLPNIPISIASSGGLCNRYIYNPSQSNLNNILTHGKFAIQVLSNGTYLYFKNTDFTDVESFKADLKTKYEAGTPVYVDYLLAEPLNLPCTEEQIEILENIPSTFSGQTNVFSEDEVKAYLRAKGLKDLNKMFSDITNAIISLGGNV